MKMKYIITPLILIALLVCAGSVLASGSKLGTAGGIQLTIPMGAQNVGVGGSNIANVSGSEAMYWNPAGLAKIQQGEVSFNYLNYFADMKISHFALATNIGSLGVVGFTLQAMDIGDIGVTTIANPEGTGEVVTPNFLTMNGTFSKAFTDRINFGMNAKMIMEKVGDMSAKAFAFDFGLQYQSPIGVDFGVVMRNFGTRIKYDGTGIEFNSAIPWADPNATTRKTKLDMSGSELPASLSMGLAYLYKLNEVHTFNVSGSYTSNSYGLEILNAGLEYGIKNMFFVRAGYNAPIYPSTYPESAKEYQYGLSLGFGAHILFGGKTIKFDYGFRDMDQFSAQHFFGVGIGW
jgi:hypothetical protein